MFLYYVLIFQIEFKKSQLTLFFPMVHFDPPENIRKPLVFSEDQKGTLGKKGLRWGKLLTSSHMVKSKSSRREVFCKKVFLKNSQNSQEVACARVSLLMKLQASVCNFIKKKRLCYRCFPVNFAKFPRTPFLTEHLRWLKDKHNLILTSPNIFQ